VLVETFIAAVLSTTMLANGVDGKCVVSASKIYGIQPSIILSIMSVEGGKVGMASRNRNNTYDLGPMQINDGAWLEDFKKFGISRANLQNDGCTNVISGTWILKKRVLEAKKYGKDIWGGVGRYHSPGTSKEQKERARKYAARAERHHKRIISYYTKLMRRMVALNKFQPKSGKLL